MDAVVSRDWAVRLTRFERISVVVPRRYEGRARGWRVDRSATMRVDGRAGYSQHLLILDSETDQDPAVPVWHPFLVTPRRGSARA